MEIIKCANGHWYDMEKSKSCPYCNADVQRKQELQDQVKDAGHYQVTFDSLHEGETVAMKPGGGESVIRLGSRNRMQAGVSASRDPITVGIVSKARGNAYITGWLVGRSGRVKGRDYRLSFGMNFIGSDPNMDVCIREDPNISRQNCSIAYDAKSNSFFIVAEQGSFTYLNGSLLTDSRELTIGDEIKMGDSLFEFIPFCREGHVWEIEE